MLFLRMHKGVAVVPTAPQRPHPDDPLSTSCMTLPRACLLMPAPLMGPSGPSPSQSARCPLETTSTLRRVRSVSSMCRVFSPAHTSHWYPHLLSSLSLPLSNSQEPPTQHIHDQGTMYPSLPQHTASLPPSIQSQVRSSCLTCSLPRPSKLSDPPTALGQLPSSPASTCICPSFHMGMIFLRHKYKQLLPKPSVGNLPCWSGPSMGNREISPPFHLPYLSRHLLPLQTHPGIGGFREAVLAYTSPGPCQMGLGSESSLSSMSCRKMNK